MKNILLKSLLITSLVLPTVSVAQQDMMSQQDMMAQMQEMSQCMESLQKQDMAKLEKEGTEFSDKVEALCAQGKRSEAQDLALDFNKKIKNSKIFNKMQQCMEKMPPSMREMMPNLMPEQMMEDYAKYNVCDRQ